MDRSTLVDGKASVVLHSSAPVVVSHGMNGGALEGAHDAGQPSFRVFNPVRGRDEDASESGLAVRFLANGDGNARSYEVFLDEGPRTVIHLTMSFTLRSEELSIELRDVQETAGWQLVHVDLARLVTATTLDRRARILIPSHGGRLLDPAACAPGERVHRYNWVREAFSQVAAGYAGGMAAVLRLDSLNDWLLSSVWKSADARCASIGARLVHRMEASRPELQFVVRRPGIVRIRLMETGRDDPRTGWVPVARSIRDGLRMTAKDPYRGSFVCKIFIGKPGSPAEIPFDAALEGVKRRWRLFDGARQVCYLVGFQHEGHDSGYPDVFTPNPAAGGAEALARLLAEAPKYNARVSFHDNYDDAYSSSPAWDPADIAMDGEAGLLKGGIWNGVQAYWISIPKYLKRKALDRLQRTLALYPVRETYHLDVLTASVFRPDYDPRSPADRNDDYEARKQLPELFRARGLDVTTEGCGLPFLETFRYFWDLPRPAVPVYEGDESVPFAAFIAHGITAYGGSEADRFGVIEGLHSGAFYSRDISALTTEAEVLDAFYLLQRPLDLLRDKVMIDYEEHGAWRRITYSDGSVVEVDFQRLTHRVVAKGRTVLEDFVSFAPGTKPGTYLAYVSALQDMGTRHRSVRRACPAEWRGAGALLATALTPGGDGETIRLPLLDGSEVVLDLPAGVPYRLRPESAG